jgi:hypothetical protein
MPSDIPRNFFYLLICEESRVKVKISLCLSKYHAVKMYKGKGKFVPVLFFFNWAPLHEYAYLHED